MTLETRNNKNKEGVMSRLQIATAQEIAEQWEFIEEIHLVLMIVEATGAEWDDVLAWVKAQS